MISKIVNKIRKKVNQSLVNRTKRSFSKCGKGVQLFRPYKISGSENIELGDFVRIMPDPTILAFGGKLKIGKYTAISCNLTVVTSNHKPTVGIPMFFNNMLHINETVKGDVIVGEDCWIGINSTLLPGCNLGRGCVVGACSMVNKKFPPYAVVVGSPAKIIAVRLSKEQIIEHERVLYPEEERLSIESIDELFTNYYNGLKSTGTSSMTNAEKQRYLSCIKSMDADLNIK